MPKNETTGLMNPKDFYLPLLRKVESDPLRTMEAWLTQFPEGASAPKVVLGSYRRGLRCVIALARQNVAAERSSRLEQLIEAAQEKFGTAEPESHEPDRQPDPLADGADLPGEAIVNAHKIPESSASCPPDLHRLAELAAGQTDEQWCEWLAKGFAALSRHTPPPHLAFLPLRLYPMGRYVNQLAAAFSEAAAANLDLKVRATDAVWNYLESGRPDQVRTMAVDAEFWQMIALLDAQDRPASAARRYVERRPDVIRTPAWAGRILPALCEAVWATSPAPAARAAFFEWLAHEVPGVVQNAWLVVALLNEAAARMLCRDEEIAIAAAECVRIMDDTTGEIRAPLDALIAAGRLDDHFGTAPHPPLRDAAELEALLDDLAQGDSPAPIEMPRPAPMPPGVSRVLQMVGIQ